MEAMLTSHDELTPAVEWPHWHQLRLLALSQQCVKEAVRLCKAKATSAGLATLLPRLLRAQLGVKARLFRQLTCLQGAQQE